MHIGGIDDMVIKEITKMMVIAGMLSYMACASVTSYAGDKPAGDKPASGTSSPQNNKAEEEIKMPEVVATVNGHSVTREEVKKLMDQSRELDPKGFDAMSLEERKMELTHTIDSLILREIIYEEAVRRKIVVTDKEVDQFIEVMKRQFPLEKEFQKALADSRITIPLLKEETRKNLMGVKLEEWAVDNVKIEDNEISAYYEKNKKDLDKATVKVSHILVKTEEEAKEVIREFKEKKEFGSLAKRYSLDTFTKDKGGDLGWYSRGELLKEVEEAAFSLSPGQISGPVKSEYGYHVIRLEEKKPASSQTLEDHRERIRLILQQAKWRDLRLEWVKILLNNSVVWKWSPEEEKADGK